MPACTFGTSFIPLFLLNCIHLTGFITGYELLYGGVVSQEVRDFSLEDGDVSAALQVALSTLPWSGSSWTEGGGMEGGVLVKNMHKSRLYFSDDNETPYILHLIVPTKHQTEIHQWELVIGLLYTFTLTLPSQHCPWLMHNFTITRDRNDNYHIYQNTWLYVEPPFVEEHKQSWLNCTSIFSEKHFLVTDHVKKPWLRRSKDLVTPFVGKTLGDFNYGSYHSQVASSKEDVCVPEQWWYGTRTCVDCYSRIVRVATYNIWNLNSLDRETYHDRLERIRKLLSTQDISIFGIQEVRLRVDWPPSSSVCQVCQLARHLPGYQYVYKPAMLYMHNVLERTEEGLAIFSRHPIISTDSVLLYRNSSAEDDTHQRLCLHAEILTPHHKVHVFVTHLSLNAESRERSVLQVWKYMSQFSGVKVLLGDFNTEPDSKVIRFLTGTAPLNGVYATGMVDTWTAVASNKNDPGYTFSALDNRPVKRIDYVFLQQPSPPTVEIVSSRLLGDRKAW